MKTKEHNVSNVARRSLARLTATACGILIGSAMLAAPALATAPSGVTGEPLAPGSLPEPVRIKLKEDHSDGFGDGSAVSLVSVIKYTVQPGGYFGWHTHGGPVWVVIAAGALTLYDGDDATCTGHTRSAGSAFLDPGNHVHNARNEGTVPVVVYATFLLPAGSLPRIDAANPGLCGF